MRNDTIVLKLGSSVLREAVDVIGAAKRIASHVTRGEKVIAVVSALAGDTDRLIAAVDAVDSAADPYRIARFVGTGEEQSAQLLELALRSVGIVARAVSPRYCGLLADGDPLDADPISLDVERIRTLIAESDVLVIPGFSAVDAHGQDVLLGRGGSDDTALFVSHQLNCHCHLIKDVDGVYESDPAVEASRPRRYANITWTEALRVAGELIQPKAIRFAELHGLSFTVASVSTDGGTTVGSGPTSFWV